MRQLKQSKFSKNQVQYENIASPHGSIKAFRIGLNGELEYTADYENYSAPDFVTTKTKQSLSANAPISSSGDAFKFFYLKNSGENAIGVQSIGELFKKLFITDQKLRIINGIGAETHYKHNGVRVDTGLLLPSYDIAFPAKSGTLALTSDIPTLLTFTSQAVAQADWVADNTYTDYGYKATITLSGVTADMIPQVIFGATEATSGKYLPIAESFAGGVYIYSKVNDAITIPTIIVQKGV